MSEEEDNEELLDEIQALERILQPANAEQKDSRNAPPSISGVKRKFVPEEADRSNDCEDQYTDNKIPNVDNNYDSYSCADLHDLLELNNKLIEKISAAHNKMTVLLEKCAQELKIVNEKIRNKRPNSSQTKIISFNAGMPYFKDKNYFTHKKNEDTETKIKNGELRLTNIPRIYKWNQSDKNSLLKAIKNEVRTTMLKKDNNDEMNINDMITKTSRLPSDVIAAIGPLGSTNLDWLRITHDIPENKHSPKECEVMWNIFLHPDINKQKWSSKESKALNELVEQYHGEDWDRIAKELKTDRSGYQCFLRYNTNNWKNLMKNHYWSKEDDTYLTKLIQKLKIGDYIPWSSISSYMNHFTKQQIYYRWTFSLAPHLKKGRFSPDEDKQLLKAVEKYGENFCKISALVLTNRTNVQLKEHYHTLTSTSAKQIWTEEKDKKLLELQKKYGSNWAKIVKEMPQVTRTQARQRHNSLVHFLEQGLNYDKIKRKELASSELKTNTDHATITFTGNSPWPTENKEIEVSYLSIDNQLIKFFEKESSSKRARETAKTYKFDKLKEDTKNLYNLLVFKMNARLDFSNLVALYSELSENQQQLLSSLKNYWEEIKFNPNEIERVRLKMFGPQDKRPPNDKRFIPPLPFGFKNPSTKKNNCKYIDIADIPMESHQISLSMQLHSDKYVSEYLKEDEENTFEKLKEYIVPKNAKTRNGNKVYSLSCKSFANSSLFLEDEVQNKESVISVCTLSAKQLPKYDWITNAMCSDNKEQFIVEGAPIQVIEPNRTTLKAYQELMYCISMSTNDSEGDYKLTSRGRYALYLFKKRYQQLFQMPIILSRIIPPGIVDESVYLPAIEKLQATNKRKKVVKGKMLK